MASDDDVAGEMTSLFRADFVPKPDTGVTAPGEAPPPGSALLVVTRGPNAGSRLVLDKTVTSAGRHPDSDIFLDDVTVSRRHAEFQVDENNNVQVVDVGSLNGTYVNREPVGLRDAGPRRRGAARQVPSRVSDRRTSRRPVTARVAP